MSFTDYQKQESANEWPEETCVKKAIWTGLQGENWKKGAASKQHESSCQSKEIFRHVEITCFLCHLLRLLPASCLQRQEKPGGLNGMEKREEKKRLTIENGDQGFWLANRHPPLSLISLPSCIKTLNKPVNSFKDPQTKAKIGFFTPIFMLNTVNFFKGVCIGSQKML